MNDKSIIFMGTPEFASTILEYIVEKGISVKAVITAPDKPAGRGRKINQSAVKSSALKLNLPILQPTNLKDPDFIDRLEKINADLFVVIAFRMLPEIVWSLPPLGTVNLHASLLPNYRGAAPINWAIINGEKETGVSTFFIEKEIDTGKIIQQRKTSISSNMKVDELYNNLMNLGAEVMVETIQDIFEGNVQAVDQSSFELTGMKPAPKIFKQDCEINFNQNTEDVHNFCRGLSPYPGAWTKMTDKNGVNKTYKILSTEIDQTIENEAAVICTKKHIYIKCINGHLKINELQPEGKRKMETASFLAGNTIESIG